VLSARIAPLFSVPDENADATAEAIIDTFSCPPDEATLV
jgi:hypothetical protein